MAIYGRFGAKVTILRKAVLADVQKLDNRKPDKQDKERIELGMLLVVDLQGAERLYDYVYLRADGACQEIDAAITATEAKS